MEKIIIVAMDENRVIGKDGDIPWHYPEDMKHFKEETTGETVLMGRKTYFSLPEDYRPLPDRRNIVLSRSDPELPEEVDKVESLEEAWKKAEEYGDKVYIAGGSSVYEQTLEVADRMVLTRIHDEHKGDTFFPVWSDDSWKEIFREDKDELSFIELEKP